MRTTGFAGGRSGETTSTNGAVGKAIVDHAFHHVGGNECHPRVHHLPFFRLKVHNHVALAVADRIHDIWRDPHSAVREHGISRGHVERGGVIRTQSHGGRRLYRCDPGSSGKVSHFFVSDFL